MHSEKLRGWNSLERDMRMAGYSEMEIEAAKKSFYQGLMLLMRIFRISPHADKSSESIPDTRRNLIV